MRPFASIVTILCAPAIAPGAVRSITVQTTPTQAVLSFSVNDPARCTVRVYSDAARTLPVDDTNPELFPGSQQCNRQGSAILGKSVSFVAGLRRAEKAADGKLHSRALAAVTPYCYTITDTSDSTTATGCFETANLPFGNLYPEQPPFNADGWDKRAYPQFDWNTAPRDQTLTDPQKGQLVKRVTFAGDAYARNQSSTDGIGAQLAPAIVNEGSCTAPENLNTSGKAFAVCTGHASIFLPLPPFQMSGGGAFRNWYPRFNVDDLILYVYGRADAVPGHNGDLGVCLAQGADLPCLSKTITVALPGHTASVPLKVPHGTPAPVFANWDFTPLHGDVVPTPGTVEVRGSLVTLTNPDQPDSPTPRRPHSTSTGLQAPGFTFRVHLHGAARKTIAPSRPCSLRGNLPSWKPACRTAPPPRSITARRSDSKLCARAQAARFRSASASKQICRPRGPCSKTV